jgi:type IV secretory pathway TraG/TraD family ATPase VirD4
LNNSFVRLDELNKKNGGACVAKKLFFFILLILGLIFVYNECSKDDNYKPGGWNSASRTPGWNSPNPYDNDLFDDTPSKYDGDFLDDENPFKEGYRSRRKNNDTAEFLAVCFAVIGVWYGLFAIPRFIWVVSGRAFGFYKPSDFRLFTKFGLPWRFIYRPIHKIKMWFVTHFLSGRKATAKFASLLETMSLVYKPNQIFLGRLSLFGIPLFQPVGINNPNGRHITMVAGTGSGKTTQLMTMLGLHNGNMFVVDCDAQMYNALKRRQGYGGDGISGKGKQVFVLDPYHQADIGVSACWNPIEEIDAAVEQHGEDMAVDAAVSLANGLIKIIETRNAWVYTGARQFMTGLILYVWRYSPPEYRNLLRVRELLTQGLQDDDLAEYDSFEVLLEAMKMKGGKIAEAAASMSGKSGERNHSRESAIDQTSWISLPQIARTLTHSDFRCRDLKTKDASLFIVAPVTDIRDKLSGWVRALTIMTMEAFQKTPGKPKSPCLFAIDEMPSLGKIDSFVDASAVFRKYGIQLITITQDVEKLRKTYPDEWKSFLGGSQCVIWMANEEDETLDYLSKRLGKATRSEHTERTWLLKKNTVQREDRAVMDQEQLSKFLFKNIIVTRYGENALKLRPAPYYTELPVFYYEPDKNFVEKKWRVFTREFIIKKNYFSSKNTLHELQ